MTVIDRFLLKFGIRFARKGSKFAMCELAILYTLECILFCLRTQLYTYASQPTLVSSDCKYKVDT